MTAPGSSLTCLAGTLIQTPVGEVPVESLVVGEMVLLASGAVGRVAAVDQAAIDGPHVTAAQAVLPMLVRAREPGRAGPVRDLYVMAPAEAAAGVALEGMAIQAANRLDRVTITVDEPGFLVAAGFAVRSVPASGPAADAPAEGAEGAAGPVVETCNRALVAGHAHDPANPGQPLALRLLVDGVAAGTVLADGAFSQPLPGALGSGRHTVIRLVRADGGADIAGSPFLLSRPAALPGRQTPMVTTRPAVADFVGQLGLVSRDRIEGFAWNPSQPDTPVPLLILDNGRVIGSVLANLARLDLLDNGIGDGRHGFDLRMPGSLSPLEEHVIQIVREEDGAELPGAPCVLPPSDAFAALGKRAIVDAVNALATATEVEHALAFVLAETGHLLQRRAELEGQRDVRTAYTDLRRRWGPRLGELGAVPTPDRRVLVVVDHLPMPKAPYAGAQLVSHVAALVTLGWQVSLVAAEQVTGTAEPPPGLEGVLLCRAPYYASAEEVLRRQAGCFDLVYVFGVTAASLYLRLARRLNPKARLAFNPGHLVHVELADRATTEARPELVGHGHARRYDEAVAIASADVTITASAFERQVIARLVPRAATVLVPYAVPAMPAAPPVARSGLALLAGRGDELDDDAAYHFVTAVMPLVWQALPDTTCHLVFGDVPQWSHALRRPGVTISARGGEGGDVLSRTMLTVAPYRFHAGLNGAVIESLGAGVPCLMSPAASDGLALPEDLAALACADDRTMAERAAMLLPGGEVVDLLGQAARRFVAGGHTQDQVCAALGRVFGALPASGAVAR